MLDSDPVEMYVHCVCEATPFQSVVLSAGVSALLAVALRGTNHIQLQKVEFGRGFGYTDQLIISMPSIGSTIFQQIVSQSHCS